MNSLRRNLDEASGVLLRERCFTQRLLIDPRLLLSKDKISGSLGSSLPYSGPLRHLFMCPLPLLLAAHSSFIVLIPTCKETWAF